MTLRDKRAIAKILIQAGCDKEQNWAVRDCLAFIAEEVSAYLKITGQKDYFGKIILPK